MQTQRLLLIYAWAIWIYRFFLFLGIALLVYHFFFKLLGLFLMMVEIGWFIMLPIGKEIKHWLGQRQQMTLNRHTLSTLAMVVLAIGVLFIPWKSRTEAPSVLKIAEHTELFMPQTGKLEQILVSKGQTVEAGQRLMVFSSSDLDSRLQQSKIKIDALRWELSFHGQEKNLINRRLVALTELESAVSEDDSLMDEYNRLSVQAPYAGQVIDVNDQLNSGEWVAKDEPLLTVGQFDTYQIEAFLAEDRLKLIQVGADAMFYPDQLDWPGIRCRIVRIDNAAALQLPPIFSSRYYGGIAVRGNNKDSLVPETSVYRVWLQPVDEAGLSIDRAIRGSTLIESQAESIVVSLWRQIAAVLIRESGF